MEFPKKKYTVIYADPPWPLIGGGSRGVQHHYPVMSIVDIKALPVASIAADDCALFLWTIHPLLPRCLEVIDAWGFNFKAEAFTWIKMTKSGKPCFGLGYWTRCNSEICYFATRGKPKRVANDVSSVILSQRGRHSEKPPEARERIVRLMGDVERVELFAREKVDGWDCWGNEV